MPQRLFPIARWFLGGGVLLAAIGLTLWFVLPIHSKVPPYLVTALLAVGYGVVCWFLGRRPDGGKP